MRNEYKNIHDALSFNQPASTKFQIMCPIAHAGYGIDLILGELVGYIPELQLVSVWDMTQFDKWTGPNQTANIVDILKLEGVLPQNSTLNMTGATAQKRDSDYRSVGNAVQASSRKSEQLSNKAALATLMNNQGLSTAVINFIRAKTRIVRLAGSDGAVQENYHWIQVSLNRPNIMNNGAVGHVVADPNSTDSIHREYARRLAAIRKDPEDS